MFWIVNVRCRNGISFELYFATELDAREFTSTVLRARQVLSCTVIDPCNRIIAVESK